jgi:hypothetical protein
VIITREPAGLRDAKLVVFDAQEGLKAAVA